MAGLPLAWRTTPADLARPLPCDRLLDAPTVSMDRAVAVAAPADDAWRWLCQLAVAPYSYDLIDNRGRRSPRELTPGAEELRVGQRMVMVFDLTEVSDLDPGRCWTGRTHRSAERLFGPIAVTYAALPDPVDPGSARLHCRMVVPEASRTAWVRNRLLAWGDLAMMRRQLLTLADLASRPR